MAGNRHESVNDGQDDDRATPAVPVDQVPGQGQEDAGSEACDDGQSQQRVRALATKPGDDDGERGLVEDARARQTNAGPDQVGADDAVNLGPGQHE
jgi:hypothetical protein